MILTATTHSLELETGGTPSTDWTVWWVDVDQTTGAMTGQGSAQGNVSSATDTALVSAPSSGVTRTIKEITLGNRDASATNAVRIQKDVSGTEYSEWGGSLEAGEHLKYSDISGWDLYDSSGARKVSMLDAQANYDLMVSPLFASANLTATRTITSTQTNCVYVGRAPRALSTMTLCYRVQTAGATITWAEVAIARGAVVANGGMTLTTVGFADVSGVINSTGQKFSAVTVSTGQAIAEGDPLWLLVGGQYTTALVVRAQSVADDIQAGVFGFATMRPSLNVGSAISFTIDTATALAPWITAVI